MTQDQAVNAFKATVQASLHGLSTLEATLESEREALMGRDPAVLEGIVKQKMALLQQLQHSVQARDRLQQAAGLTGGNDGGSTFIAELSDPVLAKEWQHLLELAETVSRLNDRNGSLTAQSQRATRQAIGILTGRDATEHTYSDVRHRRRASDGYSLAIA
jgi:flagellar biosynthesis/type III secretory pathway chaperone